MAEKSSHKGRGKAKIDEENDVFLSFINKRKRNNKKKLTEIEELEKRDPSTLKPEQLTKIKGKPDIAKQNAYWHEIKDLYYQALKSNQEEGNKKQTVQKDSGKAQEKAAAPQEEKTQKEQPQAKPKADVVRPIVSLYHLNEFFGNTATREEFDKDYMNMSGSLGFSTFPDLKAVQELSNKVFGAGSGTAGEHLDAAVHHLQQYVDGSEEKVAGKSYAYIADVVNKLVASEFFRGHKAVAAHKHHEEHKRVEHKPVEHKHAEHKPVEHKTVEHKHAEHKPVEHKPVEHKHVEHKPVEHKHAEHKGVEHKHDDQKHAEHKHDEQHKREHKHESPKKTQAEEPKKESPVKTSKKEETRAPQENTEDWGQYDEDEEEEEGKEEQPKTEKKTEKKDDDGFVTVTAKYLDKKKTEDTSRGDRRGRGGKRRGGDRGGYRGGDRGGERTGESRGERRQGGERRGEGYKGEGYKGEGGYKGEHRGDEQGERRGSPRQRRGDYQGGRRRGGQKEEYVPKQQQGTTQTQTQAQP